MTNQIKSLVDNDGAPSSHAIVQRPPVPNARPRPIDVRDLCENSIRYRLRRPRRQVSLLRCFFVDPTIAGNATCATERLFLSESLLGNQVNV